MADKQADSGRSAGSNKMNNLMRRQLGYEPEGETPNDTQAEPQTPAPDPAEGEGGKARKDMNAIMRGMLGRND